MFLKRLYRENKYCFFVVLFFIAAQFYINYKRGVVASPFYHYGMYSEVITPKDQYIITEVTVNGHRLKNSDFTPQQWDNIIQPAEKFYLQKTDNLDLWETDIRRLLPFTDSIRFINTITNARFKSWYHQRLEAITEKHVYDFNIAFTAYDFHNNRFIKPD